MKAILSKLPILGLGVTLGVLGTWVYTKLEHHKPSNQPYAGQEQRKISSLRSKDIDQLLAGKGWGLAKPAELNGYPGPLHVLEHADELNLSNEQLTFIKQSFENMRNKAKALGKELVEAEALVDEAFESQKITKAELATLLMKSGEIRNDLRNVHLTAHLEITPSLTDEQKMKYASLRGYDSDHSGHTGHEGH